MANWLKKLKNVTACELNSDVDRLAKVFRSVKSTTDCVNLFHSESLLTQTGLLSKQIELLEDVCIQLREQGLGLEPNLLGRAISNTILDRWVAGSISIKFANIDTDCCELIRQADSARDLGNYGEAQYHYWLALNLFPAHPTYRIQYGHCLKEQGLLKDALPQYIDAYYFGASSADTEPHALFVAKAIKRGSEAEKIFKRPRQQVVSSTNTLQWSVTSKDAIALTTLLLGSVPSIDEIVKYMFECNSRLDLIYKLVVKKDFSNNHRDFLRLLSETEK